MPVRAPLTSAGASGRVLACPDEMERAAEWLAAHLGSPESPAPFWFLYDGRASGVLLPGWRHDRTGRAPDGGISRLDLAWTDPESGLEVRCEAAAYADYPVVEWTVYLRNAGTADTPILESVQGLDAWFERNAGGEFVLHGIRGDSCNADSFEPYARTLSPNTEVRYAPSGAGGSSEGPDGWPYYNLQYPGGGVIVAIGWPGRWASHFVRDGGTGLRVRAGQELTRLSLRPGEEIRTPLIALLFWSGEDTVRVQNLWRRWLIAHNMPRTGGRPHTALTHVLVGGTGSDAAHVQRAVDAGIRVDLCWRDTAQRAETVWFCVGPAPFEPPQPLWFDAGACAVDRSRYPDGFRALTDWAHERGMRFVLGLDTEALSGPESWAARNRPEWLLHDGSGASILNEGDPEARGWLTDRVSDILATEGVDWYREHSTGMAPAAAWGASDAPDRQGMTENLCVQGHLAHWDELLRRHPDLHIGSCAWGGCGCDLETLRRAAPLLRSDYRWPEMPDLIEGNQGHTYGLSAWIPFQGATTYDYRPYAFRSFYAPSFGMGALIRRNRAAQQQAHGECRLVGPLMLADYYPLTPYTRDPDCWMAWQFNRPERYDGVVQAFRRAKCRERAITVRLLGLEPEAWYEISDLDTPGVEEATGANLIRRGLRVEARGRPSAAVVLYRRVN